MLKPCNAGKSMRPVPAIISTSAQGSSRSAFAPIRNPRRGIRQTNGMASSRTRESGHSSSARSLATKLGKYRPRTFSSAPPGRTMLCRGPGRVCNTDTYQKTICTSCGVLRTSSMKPSARLRTSQLAESRMMPTSRPSSVAATILSAATSSVFSTHTSKARAYVSPTLQRIRWNGMSKFVGSARKPKPSPPRRCAEVSTAMEPSSQATAAIAASSSHCATRARGDGCLIKSDHHFQAGPSF